MSILFVESVSDERHFETCIIIDFIFLLNSRRITIVIKVKQSMTAVNKICY